MFRVRVRLHVCRAIDDAHRSMKNRTCSPMRGYIKGIARALNAMASYTLLAFIYMIWRAVSRF